MILKPSIVQRRDYNVRRKEWKVQYGKQATENSLLHRRCNINSIKLGRPSKNALSVQPNIENI